MPRPLGKKKPKTYQRVAAALRYYRDEEKWPQKRLREKAGKLAIRLLAVDQVFHERTGARILSQNARDILSQVVILHRPGPTPSRR